MKFYRTPTLLVAALCLCNSIQAGVMQPGRWEVATTVVSAQGPGVRNPELLKEPMVFTTCLSKSFLDQEPYTSAPFAAENIKQQGFACKPDAEEGDAHAKKWQITCSRDALSLKENIESKVSADRFSQQGRRIMMQNNKLFTDMQVRVEGRFLGKKCQAKDIVLQGVSH